MSDAKVCEYLSWDSDFFGKRIARYCSDTLSAASARSLDAYCREESIDCVYLLADSADPGTVREAESNGFALMDIRVTFTHDLAATRMSQWESDLPVRASRPEDHEQLREIARTVFGGTRFFVDEKLRARAPELYELWVERSLTGDDEVLVAESNEETSGVSGFISCSISRDDSIGTIGLVGVDPARRGQGVGRVLVEAVLKHCADVGLRAVRVVTQGRNLPAQALYQRTGFVTSSVQLWYHKWYR